MHHQEQHQEHHILSTEVCKKVWILLLVLTVVTVASAQIDLGMFNFPLAMLIATVKALAVVLYFMGLKSDSNENRVIFFSSLIFVAIFIVLTFSDVLTRGDVYVKKPIESQPIENTEKVEKK